MAPLPLRYWVVIAVLTALVIGLFSIKPLELNARNELALSIPTPFWQATDDTRIIFIGNSLLGYGVPGVTDLEVALKDTGSNWQVAKLIRPGFNPEYYATLLPYLAETKPDWVIIQIENFYFSSKSKQAYLHRFRSNIGKLRRLISDTVFGTTSSVNRWNKTVVCNKNEQRNSNDLAERYADFSPKKRDLEFEPYLAFIDKIHAQGGKVVLLEMGRSPLAEQFLGEENRTRINEISQELAHQAKAGLWQFPLSLASQEDFCDAAHLSPSGRQVFMNWLLPRIRAEEV